MYDTKRVNFTHMPKSLVMRERSYEENIESELRLESD